MPYRLCPSVLVRCAAAFPPATLNPYKPYPEVDIPCVSTGPMVEHAGSPQSSAGEVGLQQRLLLQQAVIESAAVQQDARHACGDKSGKQLLQTLVSYANLLMLVTINRPHD